ncbi:MAG TPA: DUF2335 domain-containing protein [Pirellulales bacterium]|nr:DUF2335 domain-containing protein [Pirellulales bacterium]
MSRSSKRRKQQAKRTALAQVKREIVQNAPSAIPAGVLAQITSQVTTTSYSGPVPPPALLREYNDIVPGAAERIMAMAEKQSAHRIDLESTVVKGDSRRSWVGLWLGFVVSLAIIGAGLWVALSGAPTAGAAIITGTIVSLSGVFVYGQHSRRVEREHKADMVSGKRH